MESPESSMLSSLRGDLKSEDYIQPHYKESYRLAIDHLLSGGRDSYLEFLKGEHVGSFLSEDELLFITANAEQLTPENEMEENNDSPDNQSSSGTYWPLDSDEDAPDLEIGWPQVMHDMLETNIDLLFHPPRQNNPTIKEVIRKNIQDARQVIAIVMDVFTDVDIFREIVDASVRGVPVYVLLDDFNLKSFLAMAENQDVKIQHLRNMRVRTVKGQDYLCRSGAKFHGAMEQKFLLVDCHTTIYGSYSYTWSFEKINLSMVQVLRGQLVKSYDEEFRTLFARSTVPAELSPLEGTLQRKALQGCQILEKSHSAKKIDRNDQLRHTLDTVYRKTCERKLGTRDLEEKLMEEEPNYPRPLMENGNGVQNHLSPFQSAEAMNFYKRHSYAGERQDETTPQNMMPRASNWNISRETTNGTKHYAMDYLQVPQMYRGQNIRQTYNGNDKQVLVKQQNMPTLENTSKAFMRTWRIESYLQKPDDPFGDSCDYLDQFESRDKSGSYAQGRMRSSLVFRSNMQEQMEPNRHTNNTPTSITSSAAQNIPLHYSSMQWNPTVGDNRMNNDEFMFKRKSLQILDDNCSNAGYGPGRNAHHSVYSSYGRTKGGQMLTNPDILADNWHKRHSVADPRSNTEYRHEPSGHMYNAFARMQVHRGTSGIHAQNGGYGLNLNGDQRSISHHDVKSITGTRGQNWQEPPPRTVPAALLEVNSKDVTARSNRMGSQHFQQKKLISNIPERNEDSFGTEKAPSIRSSTSTDTLTSENERKISTSVSVRSSSGSQRKWLQDEHLNSKPRFATEDHQAQASISKTKEQRKSTIFDKSTRSGLDVGNWSKKRGAENHLYSRVEPYGSTDKRQERENTRHFSKGETATEHNLTRTSRGHHENKLEKFFQRVGNLIHKNK